MHTVGEAEEDCSGSEKASGNLSAHQLRLAVCRDDGDKRLRRCAARLSSALRAAEARGCRGTEEAEEKAEGHHPRPPPLLLRQQRGSPLLEAQLREQGAAVGRRATSGEFRV